MHCIQVSDTLASSRLLHWLQNCKVGRNPGPYLAPLCYAWTQPLRSRHGCENFMLEQVAAVMLPP